MANETLNPELTPINTLESAIGILDCYFDGWTKDDYINELNRIVRMAKQSPEWDNEKDGEIVQVFNDIISCISLIIPTIVSNIE